MSNSSCAPPSDVDRLSSWNFLISQYVGITAIIATHLTTIVAVQLIFKKSIFEKSTKILLLQSLFYANLFQFCYCIEVVQLLYKSFFKTDRPCELLKPEHNCATYFEFFLCGTSGIIYGQTGLMIERACATFIRNYPKKMRRTVGWFLFFIILVASAITGHLLLWDDPLQMYSFACFVIPKQSVPRASRFYIVCTILTLFNLVITVFIMRRNKRLEYATRFKIGARFEKRQAIDSTGTICFLAISLFIFMLIYSVGLCILLNIRSMISPVVFNFLIAWCYTIPFIAVMLPLLIIYRVNLSRTKRVKTISGITGTKQTQDDHIRQMKTMWE